MVPRYARHAFQAVEAGTLHQTGSMEVRQVSRLGGGGDVLRVSVVAPGNGAGANRLRRCGACAG
jgi:hypothetical protein